MTTFAQAGDALEIRHQHEVVRIEPWGRDSVRVRAAQGAVPESDVGALQERPAGGAAAVTTGDAEGRLVNGALTVEAEMPVGDGPAPSPLLRFLRTDDGAELLAEARAHFWWPGSRLYTAVGNGHHRLEQRFAAYDGREAVRPRPAPARPARPEGPRRSTWSSATPRSASRCCTSSRGYTLLWNNPAIGRVELAGNGTRWVGGLGPADRLLDHRRRSRPTRSAATARRRAVRRCCRSGRRASGSASCATARRTNSSRWHGSTSGAGCRCRVIVCDFFHWTHLGDWKFDPAEWPDPAAMVAGAGRAGRQAGGVVWPSVSPLTENHQLHGAARVLHRHASTARWRTPTGPTRRSPSTVQVAFYDADEPGGPRVRLVAGAARTTWSRTASRRSGWTPASRS